MLMRAGLSTKLPSSMFISEPVLTLALDGAEKLLITSGQPSVLVHVAVVIPEIYRQSLEHGIRKIPVKKALIKTSLSEILDLNGNWSINQIRSCNSL
jgi:hypothetical protein